MRILKMLLTGIIFIISIIFAAENTHTVELHYYGLTPVKLPLFLVVFLSILLGILFAGCVSTLERLRLKRDIARLRKINKSQEEELNSLRNLPLDTGESAKKES